MDKKNDWKLQVSEHIKHDKTNEIKKIKEGKTTMEIKNENWINLLIDIVLLEQKIKEIERNRK